MNLGGPLLGITVRKDGGKKGKKKQGGLLE
jgi:hypothetical protein